MWFRKTNTAPALTQELVEAVWDVKGHLKQLEARFEAELDELAKRYRRAEQSEKRLNEKQASTPCEDAEASGRVHPALRARQRRRTASNNRVSESV